MLRGAELYHVRLGESCGNDYHVYYAAADGHNLEENETFISIEKYAENTVRYLKEKGVAELDVPYCVSMGESAVMYLLAAQRTPVKKAIVDAGITPYPYTLPVWKLIALKDLITVRIGT